MKGSEIGLASMVTVARRWPSGDAPYQWIQTGRTTATAREVEPVIRSWVWWQSGGITFGLGQHIDGLAVMLLLLVTFISTLVQIFSLEYVRGDRRYTHFFAALTLFSAGMLCMVLAENMVQLILGWEIMGLCSFMLIGHWWEEEANSRAALKAFFTVRVGDIGLLVGTAILFGAAGTFSIAGLNEWAVSGEPSHQVLLWASVALFIACIGKSGQFPLHTWLPDAMAGPTPVSSLLHSSTMVVAGVFLVARLYPVFYTGLDITMAGQDVNMIALIGGITILIAAALAFVQNDIKKVLAYSTVSQLGYMMMGLGVGAWVPAVFHIFTHAFFKCCLFLCAGSVAHTGSHHSFDMKEDMGGLRKKMPITFITWMLSTAALCGVPFFSGFFSKDEIIDGAKHNDYTVFFVIGLVGAFMTAAYMTRATYLTFFGCAARCGGGSPPRRRARRGARARSACTTFTLTTTLMPTTRTPPWPRRHDAHDDHHEPVHAAPAFGIEGESPYLLVLPLIVLAFLAVVSGYLNSAPFHIEKFHHWMESSIGVEVPEAAEFKWVNAVPSIVLVALGVARQRPAVQGRVRQAASRLKGLTQRSKVLGAGHTFLVNKYYLDALYENVIVHGDRPPDRQGRVLGEPARARRHRQRRRHRWQAHRGMGLPQRRPASGRRCGQRQRFGRPWHRRRIAPAAIRQGQSVRSAAVQCRSNRCARARHRQHLREHMNVISDQNWLLSVGTFLPMAGVLVMLLIPKREELLLKQVALVTALATVVIGVVTLIQFDYGQAEKLQFYANTEWISVINSGYTIGLDGISLPLYFLSMVITVLVMIYSWDHIPEPGNPKAFFILMLVLQTGMAGTFIAQDLILFFVFFEVVLLPMYFMIGVWGGEQRQYASLKFFLYTMFGSALMLVAFLALYYKTGAESFSIPYLVENGLNIDKDTAVWIFAGMFIGFAVKVPMFPFHTWLPDAHTQAPTAGLGHPGRHPAEARHVRLRAHRHPDPAAGRRRVGAVHRHPRRHRHHLRRARLPGADRHEAPHRVQLGRPHGLRHARHQHAHRRRASTPRCSAWWPTA